MADQILIPSLLSTGAAISRAAAQSDPTIARLQQALDTLSFSNTTFAADVIPYTDDGVRGTSMPSDAFGQQRTKQVFGFIPVFDGSGHVSFYIRLGGPEIISKNEGRVVDNLSVETSYRQFPKSQPFVSKHSTDLAQTSYLNYSPRDHALERRTLQLVLNSATPSVSEFGVFGTARAQVLSAYPLRMHFNTDTREFDLQYAPLGSDYQSITDPSALSTFLIDFITSLLQIEISKQGATPESTAALVRFVKNKTNVNNIVKFVFLQRLSEDFLASLRTHFLTEYDGDGSENGHDGLWVAAFSQMSEGQQFAKTYTDLAPIAIRVANDIRNDIPQTAVDAAFPIVNTYFTQLTTADNSASRELSAAHEAAIVALNAQSAAELKKVADEARGQVAAITAVVNTQSAAIENNKRALAEAQAATAAAIESGKAALAKQAADAKADQASDRGRERLIGTVSAAAVTLWALQDDELRTLDNLQKGILVGIGALMGLAAPAGFTPVAVLAAPVTASFAAKQLRKHGVTADAARGKLSAASDAARRKVSEYRSTPAALDSEYEGVIDVEARDVPAGTELVRANPRRRARRKSR